MHIQHREGNRVDFVEARVFWHSLRVRILSAVRANPSRATELTLKLGPPLAKVVYHLSVLERSEYIQVAEGEDLDAADPVYEAIFR
jgi:predicted transcriptional regulator